MPRRRLIAIALVSALCAAAAPSHPGPAAAPTLEQVLTQFARTQASIQTLQATFEERKEISLLKEPVVQRGTFYHSKPQLFLWDYRTPTPKKVLLTDEMLLAYYPDQNKAEEVNVRRWTTQIRRYLQVGESLEELRKDYDVSLGAPGEGDLPDTNVLILEPRNKRVRQHLQEIRVCLDPATGYTRRVSYREGDGDLTVFTFRDIQVNHEIAASRYKIDLPADVKRGDTFTAFSGR
jgi:outer membrane lipoprotein-sorting protein